MVNIAKIKNFEKDSFIRGLSPNSFHLIMYPTEQCNFRCVYCYEDFEIGKMPQWVVSASKELIKSKIKSLDILRISWFGGEPLLAKRTLFDIAEFALSEGSKHNCKVSGDLTTNGYLLDFKTLKKLVDLQQNTFQISIDGDQEGHDKTRVMRNGKGSFEQIWDNLIQASSSKLDFSIRLRIHISDLNHETILKFLDRYENSILGKDKRFVLFFHSINNLGGDQEVISSLNSKETAKQFIEKLKKRYEGTTVDLEKKGDYICYASKPNSLAIRADGNLNKCTVALSDERNNIGKINPDGTLTVNNQKFSTWIKGFTTLDSWQMGCPLSYMNNNSTVGDIQVKKVG